MAFIYSLTYLTRTKVVEPRSTLKVSVMAEEENVFYRERLSGQLELIGEDFDFINEAAQYSVQCCQEITFTIERTCKGGPPVLFWQGYFNLMMIEYNLDSKVATVKTVNVRDRYSPVFASYERELNWIAGAQTVRPGQLVPDAQELVPFSYPYPQSDDYNPRGASDQLHSRNFNYALQLLVKRTMEGTGYESYADSDPLLFSQFLNADINPVTGKENYLKDVLILHLSDAKRPRAANPATVGTVTLKSILDDLKTMYNAYWFIDDEGNFRIEHISFFPHQSYDPPTVTLDLTEPKYKEVVDGNRNFSYQTDKLKGSEGFEFSISLSARNSVSKYHSILSPASNEFDAAILRYNESCVPKNTKGEVSSEYKSVINFITNWPAVILRPDTLPDEGWLLVRVTFPGSTLIPYDTLPISRVKTESGCLSATNLYYDFGRYDNSFSYGMFSSTKEKAKAAPQTGSQVTERPLRSRTTKRIKTLATIELSLCCGDEIDFSGVIKSPLAGVCFAEQLEYNLINQTVTVSLVSENTCTDNPYPDYEESEAPVTGCPAAGTLVRTETIETYIGQNAISTMYSLTTISYFADGSCSEYSSTTEEKKYIPKRNNGPR